MRGVGLYFSSFYLQTFRVDVMCVFLNIEISSSMILTPSISRLLSFTTSPETSNLSPGTTPVWSSLMLAVIGPSLKSLLLRKCNVKYLHILATKATNEPIIMDNPFLPTVREGVEVHLLLHSEERQGLVVPLLAVNFRLGIVTNIYF